MTFHTELNTELTDFLVDTTELTLAPKLAAVEPVPSQFKTTKGDITTYELSKFTDTHKLLEITYQVNTKNNSTTTTIQSTPEVNNKMGFYIIVQDNHVVEDIGLTSRDQNHIGKRSIFFGNTAQGSPGDNRNYNRWMEYVLDEVIGHKKRANIDGKDCKHLCPAQYHIASGEW